MKPDPSVERKLVRTLARFLADEQAQLGRWRMAARAAIFLGAVLWTIALFGYLQDSGASWVFAVLAGVGGLCLGVGLWFTTFVEQWPVVRQFIDADRVRRRSGEFDGAESK